MKCDCCGHEISTGSASCGNCGFQVIVALGESEEIKRKRKLAAEKYREMVCKDIEIGFYAYSHSVKQKSDGEEVLECDREDAVAFGTCGNLKMGTIIWYPEEFLRPGTEKLSCSIYIKRNGESAEVKAMQLQLPAGTGDIQIGAVQTSTGVFQICLGSGTSHTRSEAVDVLA